MKERMLRRRRQVIDKASYLLDAIRAVGATPSMLTVAVTRPLVDE